MAATATLYQHSLPNNIQNGVQNNLQDPNGLADQNQYLTTFFCRALYDYQSRDASSLSFRRGDMIEVLTQLDSGWWDGLLHDERGWFPSNYVAPVSEQELEQELRAARLDQQDPEWNRDERPEPAGPPSDFWMPQVATDGRIFYVNTQTGERSNELPTEADPDADPSTANANATAYASPTTATNATVAAPSSFARSSPATAPSQSPTAGFGLPRRSGTPEPWVKRLADDGMSYYYLNTIDGSIRWTAPSPQLEAPHTAIHDSFALPDGRQSADSTATRDRLSVYSDDSDINPLGILGRVAALAHAGSIITATTPTPGQHPDDGPDVQAARELQATLRDQFAPPAESLDDLAQASRAAITDLLDAALARSNDAQVKDAARRTMDAVRNLIYSTGTLLGPLTSVPAPYTVDPAIPDVAELKSFHRKVTATMIKLVSAVRSAVSEPSSGDVTPSRFETDAAELERAIAAFVNEVLRKRESQHAAKRVRAVLRSAEGAKGVGLELLGAGAAGSWKGFGFVEPLVGERLDYRILPTVKQHKTRLDDALVELEPLVTGEQALDIISHGQRAIRHLVSFLGLVADINIAHALDFDSSSVAVADPAYLQSVARAKELMRSLEAAVQAVFDDGAVLLNASQSASVALDLTRASTPDENRPWDILVYAIPALRSNVNDVFDIIEMLVELARSQAEACAKSGLDTSIGLRDVARLNGDRDLASGAGAGARETLRPDMMSYDMGPFPESGDGGDMVDFGDVLGARPMRSDRDGDPAAMFGRGRSDTSVDRPYESSVGTRDRGESLSSTMISHGRDTISTSTDWDGLPPSQTTLVDRDTATQDDDDSVYEEDFELEPSGKTPEKGRKIKDLLGPEAPDAYITMANASAKPWYLRAEHGAKDIFVNPDGGIRGGTLPALIERLTMHDNRDNGFNSTFLVTYKSFTTPDELFDGLVKRFYIQPPPNLAPDELKEWTKQKQDLIRIRVINILRSLVNDEDVLEKEDVHILDRIKSFASTVEKDVPPLTMPAKQLLVSVERAQSGGDAVIKMIQHTPNFPPPPIVPKTSKAMKLLDIEPLELARQLTIMESKLFAKIRPMECLNRGRDLKPGDSDDNISSIIDTSNKVAEWVADAVLSRDDSKKRAAIVKQFIAVADRCRLLQNFSTMAALVAGLNSPPIRRLKRTWEQVNARSKAQLQEAEQTMDTNKNFTRYRAILKGAQLPCVPFFGVYLSVLTFIQDGNKNMIQGDIINFSKRDRFAEVIREIKHYQSKPYNLTAIPSVQNYIDESLSALGNTADLSDRAWNLSLEREPREREDEKMARLLQESGFL